MSCDDVRIRRLILASGSPRRRQLLSLLGIPFVVKATNVDESQWRAEPPTEMVLRISQAKALALGTGRDDELIVAADTIVVQEGQVLGKPQDADEAVRMLRRLRGRPHWVYTGLSVWHPSSRRMVCKLAESLVWMRNYDDDEIAAYVSGGDPMDKAGAYAIQHRGFHPVTHVDGCWLNVIGLPLCHLTQALARFDVKPPVHTPTACQAFLQRDCEVASQLLADPYA